MAKITFDLEKGIGRVRSMHAVGQPPMVGAAVYLIGEGNHLTLTDWNSASFTLEKDQTVYLEKGE